MPKKIAELAKSMLTQPLRVSIKAESPAVDRIRQKVLFVNKSNKPALLKQVVGDPGVQRAIVFTQMKHMANRVVTTLESSGIKAIAIHGNKSQGARTKALNGFRRGTYQVLVATDVAARGIDVDDISHVINYDLPVDSETYVHRIGRTARAGAEGDAVSFCSAEDRAYLRAIERLLGDPVPADIEHEFHCEDSRNSTAPPPKLGRGGGGRNHSGRPGGRNNRGRHARGRGGNGGGRGQRGGRPGGRPGGGRGRGGRPGRSRSSAAS
jgi:ATP-dependent RNA helicase RhlE